jgi:hypothetical protein
MLPSQTMRMRPSTAPCLTILAAAHCSFQLQLFASTRTGHGSSLAGQSSFIPHSLEEYSCNFRLRRRNGQQRCDKQYHEGQPCSSGGEPRSSCHVVSRDLLAMPMVPTLLLSVRSAAPPYEPGARLVLWKPDMCHLAALPRLLESEKRSSFRAP